MGSKYTINEIYRSFQGEGHREGTENVFVRFSGCNMRCSMKVGPKSPGGFDCDTEFVSGRKLSVDELIQWVLNEDLHSQCKWVILTGGEPALQIDETLIDALHDVGFKIAIESNASLALPNGIDYIALSPKVAEHCVRQLKADEVRYVRGYGQSLPKTKIDATHYYISPAFCGDSIDERTLQWCEELVKDSKWKLSVQTHKINGIR